MFIYFYSANHLTTKQATFNMIPAGSNVDFDLHLDIVDGSLPTKRHKGPVNEEEQRPSTPTDLMFGDLSQFSSLPPLEVPEMSDSDSDWLFNFIEEPIINTESTTVATTDSLPQPDLALASTDLDWDAIFDEILPSTATETQATTETETQEATTESVITEEPKTHKKKGPHSTYNKKFDFKKLPQQLASLHVHAAGFEYLKHFAFLRETDPTNGYWFKNRLDTLRVIAEKVGRSEADIRSDIKTLYSAATNEIAADPVLLQQLETFTTHGADIMVLWNWVDQVCSHCTFGKLHKKSPTGVKVSDFGKKEKKDFFWRFLSPNDYQKFEDWINNHFP